MMKIKASLLLLLLPGLALADDPCAGLLSVLNRPTVADSVCAVKSGKVIIEGGYQYQDTYPQSGHQMNFPEIDLRFGLPGLNEFSVLAPNYYTDSGFDATVLEFKHQFIPSAPWVYAVEGFLILPTGSLNSGSDGFGYGFNGIVEYNLTDTISASLMLGGSSETTSTNAGGERFASFTPDLVLAWQPLSVLQIYAEFYGQTKTGPDQSSGFNADAGIQYLPFENMELDIEYGQRLSGELYGFARYYGVGGGLRF